MIYTWHADARNPTILLCYLRYCYLNFLRNVLRFVAAVCVYLWCSLSVVLLTKKSSSSEERETLYVCPYLHHNDDIRRAVGLLQQQQTNIDLL